MKTERFDELVDDWVRGRLSRQEREEFDALLEARPDLREEARDVRAMLGAIDSAPPVVAPEGLLASALAKARDDGAHDAGHDGARVVDVAPPRQRGKAMVPWLAAAAALLLVAGLASMLGPDRARQASPPGQPVAGTLDGEQLAALPQPSAGPSPAAPSMAGRAEVTLPAPESVEPVAGTRQALAMAEAEAHTEPKSAPDVPPSAGGATPRAVPAAEPLTVADAAPAVPELSRAATGAQPDASAPPASATAFRVDDPVLASAAVPADERAPARPMSAPDPGGRMPTDAARSQTAATGLPPNYATNAGVSLASSLSTSLDLSGLPRRERAHIIAQAAASGGVVAAEEEFDGRMVLEFVDNRAVEAFLARLRVVPMEVASASSLGLASPSATSRPASNMARGFRGPTDADGVRVLANTQRRAFVDFDLDSYELNVDRDPLSGNQLVVIEREAGDRPPPIVAPGTGQPRRF